MPNLDEFVADRAASWDELDALLGAAGSSPAKLGPDGVRRLGVTYRAAAADLALARRRFPSDPIVRRLETLVQRGRRTVYHSSPKSTSFREFVSRGYWRRVRERPALLLVAMVALALPMLLSGYWAWRDPGAAGGLAPSEYRSVTAPRQAGQDLGLSVDEQSAMAAQIFTNNIGVTFFAFSGGLLFGIGTLYALISNGILAGVVAGLSINAGNGRPFFELVLAHGILELSCICVAGMAGLRIGWAIIDPGTRPRAVALRQEARAAIEIIVGTCFWLVVAGLVEGFVTPAGTGLTTVMVIGFGLGALYWGLVLWRGRPATAVPAP